MLHEKDQIFAPRLLLANCKEENIFSKLKFNIEIHDWRDEIEKLSFLM